MIKGRTVALNRPGHQSTACIAAWIDTDERWGHELSIADCDRKISLSFPIDSEEERANSLYKIDVLYEAIQEYRRALKQNIRDKAKRDNA